MEWDHWPNQGYPCKYCGKLGHDEEECAKRMMDAMAMIDKGTATRMAEEQFQHAEQEAENKVRRIVQDELKRERGGVRVVKIGEITLIDLEATEVKIVGGTGEIRDVRPEREPAPDHDSVDPPEFLSGAGERPGTAGGSGVGPGSGGVSAGSDSREHRTRDRGEHPETAHDNQAEEAAVTVVVDGRTIGRAAIPALNTPMLAISATSPAAMEDVYWLNARGIAALLTSLQYSGFGITDMGHAASMGYDNLVRVMNQHYPDWRAWWS